MNCAIVNCPPNPSFPLLGFNSEAPDVPTFTAMGWSLPGGPPLNYDFGLTQGFAIATSTVSEQAAAAAAQSQATDNVIATWTPSKPPLLPGDALWAVSDDREFESVPPIY